MSDIWQDPRTKEWVRHVLNDMVPKLVDCALTISLVPDDPEGDVKFWVELGASIMLNKPIVALVVGDREIPSRLAAVADEIVRCPDGLEAGAEQLQEAINRVLDGLPQ